MINSALRTTPARVLPTHALSVETPVVVLSDLHLGHPATLMDDPAQVMPLLGPARTAIFNGDTFEQMNLSRRENARKVLDRLMELCLDRGVRPILLSGNHDPKASSAHYLDLFDGRVFITHGDVLHEAVAPWSREAPAILEERRRLLGPSVPPDDLDLEMLLVKRTELVASLYDHEAPKGWAAQGYMISKFAAQPWRIVVALNYWARVVHYTNVFADRHRPSARMVLLGHTHRPGVWKGRNLTVVNTGSFQPLSRPLVVHFDEERAVVHRTQFRHHQYELAQELHHFPILTAAS
jgi:predicted phosphodiesterase